MRLTLDSWVTSDHHWGHGQMIALQNRPPNHDSVMLQRWAERVKPGEIVLHLGDLIWATAGHWMPAIKDLPGEKFLIRGNHDQLARHKYETMGFTVLSGRAEWETFFLETLVEGFRFHFSHAPLPMPRECDFNVHGHSHSRTRDDGRYRNVCVEVRNYAPVRLRTLVQEDILWP